MKKIISSIVTASLLIGSLATYQMQGQDFEVEKVWKKSCRKCHDQDGSGGTPAGKKLEVKDYRSPEVQASFTDEEAIKVIKEGSKTEDGKTKMDAFPDFSDEEVTALVALVRSFEVPNP